ncbi:MAG TPA: tetratricopeptide repeat protein [Rheinheimera sp.]|uniref:tetratricopeptide repeat protein n=1 Tax=Rheinheimera sp. TaxID=1869214 RepID=UPI002F91D115
MHIRSLLGTALLLLLNACSQLPAPTVSAPAAAQQQAVTAVAALSDIEQQQFNQAKALLLAGDYAAAAVLLQPLATAVPAASGVGYNLALAQWHSGNIDGAQQSLLQVVGVAGHYTAAHNLLGVLARQQGNFRQAERHFQRALQADASYAIAHKNLAFLYELYLGELLQAHYHYKQYYQLTQDEQAKGWLALLEQQLSQEQPDEQTDL